MAPSIPPKISRGLPSWRRKQRIRPNSTAQNLHNHGDDARTSAFLHGRTKVDHAVSIKVNQSKMSSQQNYSNAQKSRPSHQERLSNQQRSGSSNAGRKRKREEHTSQHPVKRRVQLKDEAHIRGTMQIPTSKDYPEFPEDFFKNAKQAVCDSVQGLAELKSEFRVLAVGAFSCTLHFSSPARNETVTGEGRTKVGQNSISYYSC